MFSDRIGRITPSATLEMTAKAAELRAAGIDVINLSVGEPDFPTPENICLAGKQAIDDGHTRYTPGGGTMDLKKAVIEKLSRDNDLQYDTSQILISCGAKHSLYNACQVLFQTGDEIIIFSPYWVSFPDFVSVTGAKPVFVDCNDTFCMDVDFLEAAITDKTKAIVPVHYTGYMTDMRKLLPIVEKYNLPVVEDACQSILGAIEEKNAGTWGNTGSFSLHPLKVLYP